MAMQIIREPLDEGRLGQVSRALWHYLAAARPGLAAGAEMVAGQEPDGMSLSLTVPSPTGAEDRQVHIWVEDRDMPSIEFGPEHIHESLDRAGFEAILARLTRIMDGEVVIAEDIGGPRAGFVRWIELEGDELEEALTHPESSGRILLKSWSGAGDRLVQATAS